MRIAVIGMIKNSADIIESYIRGNGLYADRFILIDNDSNDNTINILGNLKNEGYDIEVISDGENAFLQSMKMNVLIRKILAKYDDIDWFVPLDDDEILISTDAELSVKDIISKWNENEGYFAKWRIYIPTEEDDKNDVCVIRRQRFIYSDRLVSEHKVIFSAKVAREEEFKIVQGNHDFIGVEAVKNNQDSLRIAHFPVRSEEQVISKALVGWTNYMANPYRKENNGAHRKKIYDVYKKTFHISIDLMWQICMLYLKKNNPEDIEIEYKPMNVDDAAFVIKYTNPNEINPFLNYIINTENLANSYAKLLKDKMD